MRSLILCAALGVAALGSAPASAAPAGDAPATIRVLLPADATLTIDGAPTRSTSTVRSFVTPALRPGRDFHYDLRASLVRDGKSVTVERQVTVRAGQETEAALIPPVPTSAADAVSRGRPARVRASAPSQPRGRPSDLGDLPADAGSARNNWKPDSSDPFYPWD